LALIVSAAGLAAAQSSTGTDGTSAPSPAPTATQPATDDEVFVFDGNDAFNPGHTRFADAAHATLTTSNTLPDDLSGYDCVVLPTNSEEFSSGQKATFEDHLETGGTLFANAECDRYDRASIATMNDLLDYLHADTDLAVSTVDLGFHTSTAITDHPVTTGVDSYVYAATTEVLLSGDATGLVDTSSGGYMLGVEEIRDGAVIVSGDSNDLSDYSSDAYSDHGNGVLVNNACRGVPTVLDAQPVLADASGPNVTAPTLTANLTAEASGEPIVGQMIAFQTNGTTVCTAETDANGTAECADTVAHAQELATTATRPRSRVRRSTVPRATRRA